MFNYFFFDLELSRAYELVSTFYVLYVCNVVPTAVFNCDIHDLFIFIMHSFVILFYTFRNIKTL